jgi:hypothetical protein
MKAALPSAAIMLGVVLVAASLVWGLVFPAINHWTPEKAKKMSEVSEETHLLSFKLADAKERPNMLGGMNPAELQAQFKAKEAELATLRQEFEGIRDKPNTVAKYLRWSGIGLVIVGGAMSMMSQER